MVWRSVMVSISFVGIRFWFTRKPGGKEVSGGGGGGDLTQNNAITFWNICAAYKSKLIILTYFAKLQCIIE